MLLDDRRGEKLGWTGGWLGSFLWLAILSVMFLFRGQIAQSLVGLALTAAALAAIFLLPPWRHPSTPYWKLMLAPYGVFFLSAVWAVWAHGGWAALGLSWWDLGWIVFLPWMLSPLWSLGRRRWSDANDGNRSTLP